MSEQILCNECGSQEFYFSTDAILCFYCKAKYRKNNFIGIVFGGLHSKEVKELPKPFVRGLN